MAEPSHFLSSFFKTFSKTAGNIKSKISERKDKFIAKYPALPDEIQRQYTLAEIKAATNNFDENLIIGKSGFGNVYKGFFKDGNLVVAVKRLNPQSAQGFNGFQKEMLMLSQLQHQHLVSLLGFCFEDYEMILVHDYMRNGSIRNHLYESGYDPLPWKKRLQICVGAARGLHYLHTGAKQTIIHRDINSRIILLDNSWDCKLGDFRLSKIRPRNKSKAFKRIESVRGTRGYLDPECRRGSEQSEKSDVYSFGVVLLEVLCARKAVNTEVEEDQCNLAVWARKCIKGGSFYNIIDPYLMGRIAPACFKIFVETAFCCTNEEGNTRPEAGEVELMLELALEMQKKADSDHTSPHAEYVLEQISFAAIVAKYTSEVDGSDDQNSMSLLSK